MEIILTGTGSPLPDPNRAGPSSLVKADGTHILVDAGRGVVMRLAAAGSDPALLAGVLITHLHSDHICALNDVITTHWVRTREITPLKIFGPVGIARFVERQLHALEDDIGYRVEHHDPLVRGPQVEVTELQPGDEFRIGDVDIITAATQHAPVHPTIGFRLKHEGAVAALVGDTIPCDGVDQLAAGADVYVQTVLRKDIVELLPGEMAQDILEYHSGVVEAAQTAARVGAKRLALTHMVPAPTPEQYPEWIARAAEHYDGEIVIGNDLTTIIVEHHN
ncbi:MAG: MBL fold metallo-hydrolase [Ilumatobacter sp.]|nr:MBL fold metallo-hydrolase [Ilumatobacter sp.]MDG1695593.1 MBL fold metallo-hydrolase [Ilumatobacter sp.]